MTDFTLRPATPEDDAFLYALYCSTRAEEMAAFGFNDAQRDAFLRMQYQGQRMQYGQLAGTTHHLVLHGGAPVGRLLVMRSDAELRLVDVALLPQLRGQGVGTALLRQLQEEAGRTGKPLALRVLKGNPAARLYDRMGFALERDEGLYLAMAWRPS